MIHARCHSDDRAVEVYFDAEPWFIEATDEAILRLALCGWGGDYPADEVALFMAGTNVKIAAMFTYIDIRKRISDCGFECYVDDDDALEWAQVKRPALAVSLSFAKDGFIGTQECGSDCFDNLQHSGLCPHRVGSIQ